MKKTRLIFTEKQISTTRDDLDKICHTKIQSAIKYTMYPTYTVKPLYSDSRYNDEIRYNDILNVTIP